LEPFFFVENMNTRSHVIILLLQHLERHRKQGALYHWVVQAGFLERKHVRTANLNMFFI